MGSRFKEKAIPKNEKYACHNSNIPLGARNQHHNPSTWALTNQPDLSRIAICKLWNRLQSFVQLAAKLADQLSAQLAVVLAARLVLSHGATMAAVLSSKTIGLSVSSEQISRRCAANVQQYFSELAGFRNIEIATSLKSKFIYKSAAS